MQRNKRILFALLLAVGLLLETLAIYGGIYYVPIVDGGRGVGNMDPVLANKLKSVADILEESNRRDGGVQKVSTQQQIRNIENVVQDIFTLGRPVKHSPLSNWILWLAGKFHPVLGTIFDADLISKWGGEVVCSQSSYVFVQAVNAAGFHARQIGLNGHVMAEVWYNGDWHAYDPSFRVDFSDPSGQVVGIEVLSRSPELARKILGNSAHPELIPIILSREDNTYVSLPVGAYFEWKSQAMLWVERAAELLKFILPAILFVIGAAGLRSRQCDSRLQLA